MNDNEEKCTKPFPVLRRGECAKCLKERGDVELWEIWGWGISACTSCLDKWLEPEPLNPDDSEKKG